ASRTSPATGPTSASATSTRSKRRPRSRLSPHATSVIRRTPRRTGSSASITLPCARRPRSRSNAHRGAPQAGAPQSIHHPSYPGDAPMDTNVGRRQAINGLIVATLLAGMIAVGLANALPANDPPAPKADDFSSYVTKDGGISLPLDYREKF